jgi:hypothetical protein
MAIEAMAGFNGALNAKPLTRLFYGNIVRRSGKSFTLTSASSASR